MAQNGGRANDDAESGLQKPIKDYVHTCSGQEEQEAARGNAHIHLLSHMRFSLLLMLWKSHDCPELSTFSQARIVQRVQRKEHRLFPFAELDLSLVSALQDKLNPFLLGVHPSGVLLWLFAWSVGVFSYS